MFTRELYFTVSPAEFPQTDFFSMDRECMVRDRIHDVLKDTASPYQIGNDHLPVFIIRQCLPILELRLDARAKIVVDGADHIDFMVADLVDIRQRILIDRVDERH